MLSAVGRFRYYENLSQRYLLEFKSSLVSWPSEHVHTTCICCFSKVNNLISNNHLSDGCRSTVNIVLASFCVTYACITVLFLK